MALSPGDLLTDDVRARIARLDVTAQTLVEGPVTWLCDARDDAMWRIDAYAMQRRQPTNRRRSPLDRGNVARAADLVERCAFGYVAGPVDRGGLDPTGQAQLRQELARDGGDVGVAQ